MSLRDTYDRQAAHFDAARDKTLFERAWLDRVLADVPPGGAVLDLGCGAGRPIGTFLVGSGYAVTGVDFSTEMLRLYSDAVPGADVVEADMRSLSLNRRFDAIIGWGSFFHLTMDDQRQALPRIADHLLPGGRLLLTVGPEAGDAWGTVGGEAVYHASLSEAEYRTILAASGVPVEAFVHNDPDCRRHSLLLARRNAAPPA